LLRDLKLKVFRRKKAQLLSDSDREKRVKCCKTLHSRCLQTVDKVWFSDEKIFTVQPPINTQNDRLYSATKKKSAISSERLIKGRKHFSESVMVSVAVSKAGKTEAHFIDKGTKVDGRYYRKTLLQKCLLPDIRQKSCGEFVFQQDGAPSHRVKLTVEFLQQNVPNFIEPSVWPPNSPDLNPVDYAVWGALQQAVYRSPIVSLVDLKNRVRTCWASLDQQFINKAVDQWRPRLQAVIRAHGGHIEQLFT